LGVGQSNGGEKLRHCAGPCDRYGHLARYCRVIRPYRDDNHMYSVDRRLEPREELLWKGTRVHGFVTCNFAKPGRSQ